MGRMDNIITLEVGTKIIVAHMQSISYTVYDFAMDEVVKINKTSYKLKSGATIKHQYREAFCNLRSRDYTERFVGVITGKPFSSSGCAYYELTNEKLHEISSKVEKEQGRRNEYQLRKERKAEAMKEYYVVQAEAQKEYDAKMYKKWNELLCSQCVENVGGICSIWKNVIAEQNNSGCSGFEPRKEDK